MGKKILVVILTIFTFFWGVIISSYIANYFEKEILPQPSSELTVTTYPTDTPSEYKPTPTITTNINNNYQQSQRVESIDSNYLWFLVNNYRNSIGKQSWIQREEACQIARARAEELFSYTQQYGMLDKHQGMIKYESRDVYYSEITVMTPYGAKSSLDLWLSSPGHKAILDSNFIYGCCASKNNVASVVVTNFDNNDHL